MVNLCPSFFKILSENQILMSIKGRYSVANLRNMTLYNPNIDLVYDNVYKKFDRIVSIHSPDIEQKPNSDVNQGPNSVANLRKMTLYYTNIDLVNDNVYTKVGLISSIRSQEIEIKPNSDVNQGP